jgi:uncharacterized membrane protein YfcA
LGTALIAMVRICFNSPHLQLAPSLSAFWTHIRLGNVVPPLAAQLAAGTAVGAFVGARAALAAEEGVLRGVFAVVMTGVGLRTIWAARRVALRR